jgi:AcrR family transcriptional regulator
MSAEADRQPVKRSEARERLLATASRLFYSEGIRGVGVDRIVSESRVTLATFYRHFPSKEDLVVSYLERVHDLIAEQLSAATGQAQGRDRVRAVGAAVSGEIEQNGFRGCAFINAASETEDPDSPIRHVIARHRRWYYETVRKAFIEAGHKRPGNAARHFVMLRDGAMIAASLDSPSSAKRIFSRGVDGMLRSIDVAPLAAIDDADDPDPLGDTRGTQLQTND